MKYAIPSIGNKGWEDEISGHFVRAPFYTIWKEETNEIEVIANTSDHFGGKGLPPEFLSEHCNGLICGGIGTRAIALCEQLGIKVIVGAGGTIKQVISDFKNGKLRIANPGDGCKH